MKPAADAGRVAVALLLFVGSGCTTGTVDSGAAITSSAEGYFVLGFRVRGQDDDTGSLTIYAGNVVKGVFHATGDPVFVGSPEDGYIVGKAPAGSTLGVTAMGTDSIMREAFVACNETTVFKVKGGAAEYVTNIEVMNNDRAHPVPSVKRDFESARTFIASHFPQMSDRLEQARSDAMPLNTGELSSILWSCG